MITTSTGAKKLESSDNWREIFPNPGTSAAGAHNASVDAADRIQPEIAPIINGKQCALGAASGDYVLLRNSTIAGKSDGAYQATKAIPANTDLDSTYLGSAITGGMVNELNNNLTNQVPEFISNANGNAYKFPSGMMVCTKNLTINAACTNPWGDLYESQHIDLGSWPIPFQYERPCVSIFNAGGQGGWFEYVTDTTGVLVGKTYLVRPTQNTADVYIDIIGIGRWK